MTGAAGAMAATANDCVTVGAASVAASPGWSASIVQVPADTNVRAPPAVMVHTPVVVELKATVRPALDVAVNVGEVPNSCAPGLAKVIDWLALGVTAFDSADATLSPTEFVAVTVKV